MSRALLVLVLAGLGAATFAWMPAAAHGGGLDSYGCHRDNKAGQYHCHRGPCAGNTFANQKEMLGAACNKTSPPPKK